MGKKIDREELDALIESEDILVLYFGSETCSVCVDLKPKLKTLLNKYEKIKFLDIDMAENIKLSRDFSIFTMPAILMYVQSKEVIREARYLSLYELDEKISRYYGFLFDDMGC